MSTAGYMFNVWATGLPNQHGLCPREGMLCAWCSQSVEGYVWGGSSAYFTLHVEINVLVFTRYTCPRCHAGYLIC